ncbi:MAG: hypothetical protein ACTSXJ_03520 [Candidatus Baldrarchaeia archaeon]
MSTGRILPLKMLILQILKRQQILRDDELLEYLNKYMGEVSASEFNRALMQLEIQGLIHVSPLKKNIRKIELLGPGKEFMGAEED